MKKNKKSSQSSKLKEVSKMSKSKKTKSTKSEPVKGGINLLAIETENGPLATIFHTNGDTKPLFKKFTFAVDVFLNETYFTDGIAPLAAVVITGVKEEWNDTVDAFNAHDKAQNADYISYLHPSGFFTMIVKVENKLPKVPNHIIEYLKGKATKSIGREMTVIQEDGSLLLADAKRDAEVRRRCSRK